MEVIEAIKHRENQLYSELDEIFKKIQAPAAEIEKELALAIEKLNSIKNALKNSAQIINPDNYEKISKIDVKGENLVKSNIISYENQIQDNVILPTPVFDIMCIKNCINTSSSLVDLYANKISNAKEFKLVSSNSYEVGKCKGFSIDKITKRCYSVIECESVKVIEYKNEADLMQNIIEKEIHLEKQCGGTYIASHNDYLYYPIYNTDLIAQLDLKLGKITATLSILNGKKPENRSVGCSNSQILIIKDSIYDKIYVFYVDKQCKLSLLESNPKLSLGNTWILPNKVRDEVKFLFIHGGKIYMGSKEHDKLNLCYDLNTKTMDEKSVIVLPEKFTDIRNIIDNGKDMIILHEMSRGTYFISYK